MSGYRPPQEIVERYAHLIVQHGLGDSQGIQPGETVRVSGHEDCKPLYYEVCREIWRQGGHVIHNFMPENDGETNFLAAYYELASDAQLAHFPEPFTRGWLEQTDHMIFLNGERDPLAARDVDSARRAKEAPRLAQTWALREAKERAGELDWTIALWGTPGLAAEAGLTLEEYWAQIIAACFLDDPDPVARWAETIVAIHRYRDWLNELRIDRLHVEAEGTDLWLTLGERRLWVGGDGYNIPGFEIFSSPDWRGTEGTIAFTEPLYRAGKLIRGARLTFADGEVIDAGAEQGEDELQAMLAMPGANRLGEFSLTDARLSPITRFMAETLYDENVGGRYGNTHVAIGMAYTETYDGDESAVSDEEWRRLGYNIDATIHTDIVATSDRTVTATLADGSERVIYTDGRFTLD